VGKSDLTFVRRTAPDHLIGASRRWAWRG